MTDLMNMLASSLDADTISKIGKHVGVDASSTKSAIGAVLPTLLGALSKNASSKEGADALFGAVSKDHDGGILGNVASMLGSEQGAAILGHVLGAAAPQVSHSVAKATGIDAASSQKLLETLAPVVMGVLGKKQRDESMDADGLAQTLAKDSADSPAQSALNSLLDGDGDGDVDLSDLLKHGSKFFG